MPDVFEIYIKLAGCATVSAALSALLYLIKRKTKFGDFPRLAQQVIIGILFGAVAIFGTEFGVDIGGATANARDAAPLCAGLLFGAPAGVIAGLIGGIERWFAVAWGAGMYSRIACTVSTIFAGIYAGLLRKIVFDDKRPTLPLAFVTGGVMEIIHMTVLFLTHLTDSEQAFEIVKICTVPMVLCNGLSVFASTLFIMLLSSGVNRGRKNKKNISQLFQTPMLISVVLAYLASTAFVYFLQTYSAKENAVNIISLNIADIKQEILDASDKHLISITRSIASELESDADIPLKSLAEKYNVSDIWLVNDKGIIYNATDGSIGFDMHYDIDKPEEERQSSKFLVLLTDECDEYVQEYRPLARESTIKRKLAGVSMKNGGFVQTGYDAERFQAEIYSQVKDLTKNRRIGKNGHIIIVDHNMEIISDIKDISPENMASEELQINEKTVFDKEFDITINGTENLCMISQSEGFTIIALLPHSEIYKTRDTMAYINSYMEILVFALLFILIYIIIKNVVVNNLHKINSSLGKIIGGSLETTIDVYSSNEFASLSDDINSTVSTLKLYIEEAASRIDKELAFAKSIQHSALPSVFPPYPERKDFDIYATMDTAKEVGGDFYDFYLLDEKHVAILIADVSGKGIPAAMFMMTAKTTIKSLAETGLPVNEIFTQANEKLCEGNEAGMFVTAWMGIVNTETGHVDFANAGHNPPLIYRKDKGFEYIKSKAGFVLAGMEGIRYKKQELELAPGDRIYLYTDGVTEANNSAEELFGEDRLLEYLNQNSFLPAKDLLLGVKSAIDNFSGNAEQFDDITMLSFDYFGNEQGLEFRDFDASDSSLAAAMDFITSGLEAADASPKTVMQVSVAFEEMFVNVAHYAYPDSPGKASVGFGIQDGTATIVIKDSGTPFDPFAKADPDISLSAEERQIGGLGIFMTKKVMDKTDYEYRDGCNIVTMQKKL